MYIGYFLFLPFRYITHIFDLCCRKHNIEHRTTKVNHPWTNGQVERMNRTIKEATVKRYHYGSHDALKAHIQTFLMAYNFAKRLKNLSAKYGRKTQISLLSTRTTTLWG